MKNAKAQGTRHNLGSNRLPIAVIEDPFILWQPHKKPNITPDSDTVADKVESGDIDWPNQPR
jgi:hypothetical protein